MLMLIGYQRQPIQFCIYHNKHNYWNPRFCFLLECFMSIDIHLHVKMSRTNTVCYWLLKILPNSPTSYMYSSTAQIQMTATATSMIIETQAYLYLYLYQVSRSQYLYYCQNQHIFVLRADNSFWFPHTFRCLYHLTAVYIDSEYFAGPKV